MKGKKPAPAKKKPPVVKKKEIKPAVKTKAPVTIDDEAPKKKVIVSLEYLAKFVGVEPSRIYQLRKQGVITEEPKTKGVRESARFDLMPALLNIIRFYREKSDSRKSNESEDMANTKLKRLEIKLKKEELELGEIENNLHKSADIERVMGAALTRLRINLLAIPLGVAPLIRDKKNVNEIAEIINERICRALNELVTVNIDKLLADEEGAYSE